MCVCVFECVQAQQSATFMLIASSLTIVYCAVLSFSQVEPMSDKKSIYIAAQSFFNFFWSMQKNDDMQKLMMFDNNGNSKMSIVIASLHT